MQDFDLIMMGAEGMGINVHTFGQILPALGHTGLRKDQVFLIDLLINKQSAGVKKAIGIIKFLLIN